METRGSKELARAEGVSEQGFVEHRFRHPDNPTLSVVVYVGEPVSHAEWTARGLSGENPFRAALQKFKPGEAKHVIEYLTHALDEARTEVTEDDLEAAVAELRPSPAMAAAKASAQAKLDALNHDAKARLLAAGEMAEYVDKARNWASESARNGRLISVKHAGKTYYPAFQIDPVHRQAWAWVPTMARILENEGVTGRSFTLWAATESPRFGGDLPATHTGDPDFMAKAAADLAEL